MSHRREWDRRAFLRAAGVSPAIAPLLPSLSALAGVAGPSRKQRLVVVFSPNGVVPDTFWPEPTAEGDELRLPPTLEPLAPFRDRTVVLKGLDDQLKGDGDNHMRGMGCLLTGAELFPGNVQGGGRTPAGWASGISVDQHIKNELQRRPESRTRFGSLEFGVLVPDRADTWTRMVYAGPNKPVTPVDDPYQMFAKLYGEAGDRRALRSVLDNARDELARLRTAVGEEDRRMLDEHAELVRGMERRIAREEEQAAEDSPAQTPPRLEPGVRHANKQMPRLSRMQIELIVASLSADFARVATLQYTKSVGGARMTWLGVDASQHELSHRPDSDTEAQDQLTRINRWYAGEVAHLASRLAETPDPGGGSLLDSTLIVWTNELGKGNNHTLRNIPFVLVGGAPGLRGGRALDFGGVPHNRLLMWLAAAQGCNLRTFGREELCDDGVLTGLA